MSDLALLQARILAALTGRGPAAPAVAEIEGTADLTAEARLGIYARGYVSRLLECLRGEYPVLRRLVGDHVFDLFARGYLAAQPPATYSMHDLGAGFAEHLEATRPRPPTPPDAPDALPAALARLERARLEAGRARGVEADPEHRSVDPLSVLAMPGLVLRTPESLRLLHLQFALAEAVEASDRGDRPAVPAAQATYYAVARSRYRVRVHVVSPWQHTLLTACAGAGVPAEAAVAAVTADTAATAGADAAIDRDRLWSSVATWLPAAADAGMVTVTAATGPAPPCWRPRGGARAASSP